MRTHNRTALKRFGVTLVTASLVGSAGLAFGVSAANAAENMESGELQVNHEMNQGFLAAGNGSWIIANQDVNGSPVNIGDPQQMWDGNSWTTPEGNPWQYPGVGSGTSFVPQMLGSIQPIADPSCVADTVRINVTANFTNRGPAAGVWTIGDAAIINHNIQGADQDKIVHRQAFGQSNTMYPVGSVVPLNLSYEAPLTDLQAGALDVTLSIELSHNGVKSWDVTDFNPTYDVLCDPTATPVTQTVMPTGTTPIDLTGHVTTDLVDPDWSTLKLTGDNGLPVDTLTRPEGTYTVQPGGQVSFVPNPDFTGGPVGQPVAFTVADGRGKTTGSNITLTVARPPLAENLPATTETTTPVTVDPVAEAEGRDGAAIDPASVRFVVEGDLVDTLTIPGKGTFTVDPTTGKITFQAVEGFTGQVDADYSIADSRGLRTERKVSVEVSAKPAPPTITVDPKVTAKDFIDPDKGATISVTGCTPGETVTYLVTPKGNPNVVAYRATDIADADGNSSLSVHGTGSNAGVYVGDYDVTVTCGGVTLTGSFSVTGAPDGGKGSGTISGSPKSLASTGGADHTALFVGGAAALLVAGAAVTIVAMRRRRIAS